MGNFLTILSSDLFDRRTYESLSCFFHHQCNGYCSNNNELDFHWVLRKKRLFCQFIGRIDLSRIQKFSQNVRQSIGIWNVFYIIKANVNVLLDYFYWHRLMLRISCIDFFKILFAGRDLLVNRLCMGFTCHHLYVNDLRVGPVH